MMKENFGQMSSRWNDFSESRFNIKNSECFLAGYAFGKIEHKFAEWFYSTHGRSLTDEEYQEFFNIVTEQIKTNS